MSNDSKWARNKLKGKAEGLHAHARPIQSDCNSSCYSMSPSLLASRKSLMKNNTKIAFAGIGTSAFLSLGRRVTISRTPHTVIYRRAHPKTRSSSRGRLSGSLKPDPVGGPVGDENSDLQEPQEALEDPGLLFTKLEEARKGQKVANAVNNVRAETIDLPNTKIEVSTTSAPLEQEVIPEGLQSASRALWRIGWFAWWLQLILTVIAAVILLFAFLYPGINIRSAASGLGFAVSGVGIVFAFLSLFWTYGYTRLALWLREKQAQEKATQRLNRRLRFGLVLSITGMVILLLGLQAIVGTLLARLLGPGIASSYAPGQSVNSGVIVSNTGLVQPVDILVVQACANGLTGLLIALMTTVWFRAKEKKWTTSNNIQGTS